MLRILLFVASISLIHAQWAENGRCLHEVPQECADRLQYNTTRFPNLLNHTTPSWAYKEMKNWTAIFKDTSVSRNCTSILFPYLCTVYFPVCALVPVKPCRHSCEDVQNNCMPYFRQFGLKSPLNCYTLPTILKVCADIRISTGMKNGTTSSPSNSSTSSYQYTTTSPYRYRKTYGWSTRRTRRPYTSRRRFRYGTTRRPWRSYTTRRRFRYGTTRRPWWAKLTERPYVTQSWWTTPRPYSYNVTQRPWWLNTTPWPYTYTTRSWWSQSTTTAPQCSGWKLYEARMSLVSLMKENFDPNDPCRRKLYADVVEAAKRSRSQEAEVVHRVRRMDRRLTLIWSKMQQFYTSYTARKTIASIQRILRSM